MTVNPNPLASKHLDSGGSLKLPGEINGDFNKLVAENGLNDMPQDFLMRLFEFCKYILFWFKLYIR